MAHRFISSSAPLLLLFASACHGLVETCEELKAAFDLTKNQDVVIEMNPSVNIDCLEVTTMSMNSNSLTVVSTEDFGRFSGSANLSGVRFEVTNGASLVWETNVRFDGPQKLNLNGGAVFVGEGSTVRFLNDLTMRDVGILSVPDETYDLSGGCVYTDGYFRVDGYATFITCEVAGGGESSPGPGGALYVGEEGSVLFNGPLEMTDISIIDDIGGDGGGIYNRGKVNIKGNAKFQSMRAKNGGALYNAPGAQFRFKNQASALFIDCTHSEGTGGGALFNEGLFKFSGPALFVETEDPTIIVSSTGKTVLSENSVFWEKEDIIYPAILVSAGGEIDIPSSVSFFHNVDSECNPVLYREDDLCLY